MYSPKSFELLGIASLPSEPLKPLDLLEIFRNGQTGFLQFEVEVLNSKQDVVEGSLHTRFTRS